MGFAANVQCKLRLPGRFVYCTVRAQEEGYFAPFLHQDTPLCLPTIRWQGKVEVCVETVDTVSTVYQSTNTSLLSQRRWEKNGSEGRIVSSDATKMKLKPNSTRKICKYKGIYLIIQKKCSLPIFRKGRNDIFSLFYHPSSAASPSFSYTLLVTQVYIWTGIGQTSGCCCLLIDSLGGRSDRREGGRDEEREEDGRVYWNVGKRSAYSNIQFWTVLYISPSPPTSVNWRAYVSKAIRLSNRKTYGNFFCSLHLLVLSHFIFTKIQFELYRK